MCEINSINMIQRDIDKMGLEEDEVSLVWFLGMQQWEDSKSLTFKSLKYEDLWNKLKKEIGKVSIMNNVAPDISISDLMERLENESK